MTSDDITPGCFVRFSGYRSRQLCGPPDKDYSSLTGHPFIKGNTEITGMMTVISRFDDIIMVLTHDTGMIGWTRVYFVCLA